MRFDMRIHDFYNDLKNIRWLDFKTVGLDEPYNDYYYAEDELYIIRDRVTECIFFTEARSPKEAFENMRAACTVGYPADDVRIEKYVNEEQEE